MDPPIATLASRTEYRTTTAPAQADPHTCLYYDQTLCLGSDTVGAIASVIAAVGQVITIIIMGRQGGGGGGNGDGDEEIEIEDEQPGSEDDGDCLRAVSSPGFTYVRWDACSTTGSVGQAETWIEVPTGGSVALESEYFYVEDDRDYMQVTALSGGADRWPPRVFSIKTINGSVRFPFGAPVVDCGDASSRSP